MDDGEDGVFLTIPELKAIFSRLKQLENTEGIEMRGPEREGLLKIERFLYDHLSIQEVEKLIGSSG
ncbi:MAG: hypothetical protein LBP76_02910 [Treponema sp.]|jgi:hypothetical protein|nr:hypothetical protein [Treponema sp.]